MERRGIIKAKWSTNFEVQLHKGDVVHQHIHQLVKHMKAVVHEVLEEPLLVEEATTEVESDNSPPSRIALEVPD